MEKPDPRTTSVIAGTRLDLLEALETLERDRPQMVTPLVLRDVYGLSYEEIALEVGAPLGTVKSRIHDAREVVGGIPQAQFRRTTGSRRGGSVCSDGGHEKAHQRTW